MAILVSITCVTYNHEKYIAEALEGFLMQKTDFQYEILIYDDASTDNTANIIRSYKSRFPDIIKPIYQTENQYAKKLKNNTTFNLPRAQGKYIALCEGDDYWTDPLKLQKQADYMEEHPDCSMCFHAVQVVKHDGKPTGRIIAPYKNNCIVPIEDLITGGGFLGTNSLFFPKKCMQSPPEFYWRAPVGDVPLTLYLASQGSVYYLNDVMSSYRTGVEGSWTSRISASNQKKREFRLAMMEMINEFDRYTNYRYTESVKTRQAENELLLLLTEGNIARLKEPKYRKYYEQLGLYVVALILLYKYFPGLYEKLRIFRKHIVSKMAVK